MLLKGVFPDMETSWWSGIKTLWIYRSAHIRCGLGMLILADMRGNNGTRGWFCTKNTGSNRIVNTIVVIFHLSELGKQEGPPGCWMNRPGQSTEWWKNIPISGVP